MTESQARRSNGIIRRAGRIAAAALACVVLGSSLHAAGLRSIADLTLIFDNAPLRIVPEGHVLQTRIVRSRIPPGDTILYVMPDQEAWQFGLWQRSLYPDYVLIPIRDFTPESAGALKRLQAAHHVRFVLAAGTPPPAVPCSWMMTLPPYPYSVPITFGLLAE